MVENINEHTEVSTTVKPQVKRTVDGKKVSDFDASSPHSFKEWAEGKSEKDLPAVTRAFTDGGVVFAPSSPYGGSWAFVLVDDENNVIYRESGFVHSRMASDNSPAKEITNNTTELIAAVKCFEFLPENWSGVWCPDSEITINRFYKNSDFEGCWESLVKRAKQSFAKLGKVEYLLHAGHPTYAELETGWSVRKPGMPVSVHNKMCDTMCGEIILIYLFLTGLSTNDYRRDYPHRYHTPRKEKVAKPEKIKKIKPVKTVKGKIILPETSITATDVTVVKKTDLSAQDMKEPLFAGQLVDSDQTSSDVKPKKKNNVLDYLFNFKDPVIFD